MTPTPALPSFRRAALLVWGALSLLPAAASAALAVGATTPDFTLDAAVGGKAFRFTLSEALRQGPVVLYFYPKSFTSGCTVEAHQFSEATAKFKALGATVVGVSNDSLATQQRFSVEACRGQFAVVADEGGKVIKQFDAGFLMAPSVADRISYVIEPPGRVLAVHASMDPNGHVGAAMAAVQAWQARQTKR